jgi:hypothetical protein
MAVPYTFGTATASIPLSQLDSNFATVITLGNTAIQLGNTVTTLNNMTLANVTISSGNVTLTNVTITTANVTTANVVTLIVTGNETVQGNTTVTGTITGAKLIPTGSSVTGNGMYLPAANSVGISTNGTNAVYIDSTQNVGIGAISSGAKLAVTGTLSATGTLSGGTSGTGYSFSGSAPAGSLALDSSGNLGLGVTPSAWGSGSYKGFQIGGSLSFMGRSGGSDAYVMSNTYFDQTNYRYTASLAASRYTQSGGEHQWFNAASGTAGNAITFTQAMTLDSSGNLLVGTAVKQTGTAPTFWTNSTTAANGGIGFIPDYEGAGEHALTAYSNNATAFKGINIEGSTIRFWIGASLSTAEKARIDSSGNLGVGTSSPTSIVNYKTITVNGTTGSLVDVASNGTVGGRIQCDTTYPGMALFTLTNNPMVFGTNGTERMRLDSSGNLLVGTTSVLGLGKISVKFDGTSQNGICAQLDANTSGSGFAIWRDNTGNTCGQITRVGTTSAVVYTATSDYRLKNVVGAVTGQGARIDALKPIDYQWKEGNEQARGFLAHEFQEVYPSSVSGDKDAVDKDGKPAYQSMQASSAEVIADLVAELQSLRARVAQLESKP